MNKKIKYSIDFKDTEFLDVDLVASGMAGSVAPIIFRKNGTQINNQGTAFCVAVFASGEALYITAKHVVIDLNDTSDVEPFILLPNLDDSNFTGVPIKEIRVVASNSDVALLVINIKNAVKRVITPSSLKVSFSKPIIGEYCMALGCPHVNSETDKDNNFSYILNASRGKIITVYESKRDKLLVNYPSFETTGLYKPSMSGGPIIDQAGHVIGLISSGMEVSDDQKPMGHGACIGAMGELKVNLTNDKGVKEEYSVSRLAQEGLLGVPGPVLKIDRIDDGVVLKWEV